MSTVAREIRRTTYLPFSIPAIGQEEIQEVVDSLRSGWLTTGPKVKRFEEDFARYVGASYAIAMNSCTAALHLALAALGIGPGDEVIVPTMTFCATANVVVHLGARPVLVDVDEHCEISVEAAARAITGRTKAIIPVHYGGQPCDLQEILSLAGEAGVPVIEDAAHAAGSEYHGRKIGTHGWATAFSFYANKNMTTGEGGIITTGNKALADRLRVLALHGISRDAWKRYAEGGSWYYEVLEPGYKDNMTDLQAALGIHQLRRLDGFIGRRREIARQYDEGFADLPELRLPYQLPGRKHTYHLYAIQLNPTRMRIDRDLFIAELSRARIGASVHFIPLHRHPYYRKTFGYRADQFPMAERIYEGIVSLPLFPGMTGEDVSDVIETVRAIVAANRISAV